MRKGIIRYKTFAEARMDMYREMWEMGFDEDRMKRALKEFEDSIKRFNLPSSKLYYPPGIYPFKTFEDAQRDVEERMKRNDNP